MTKPRITICTNADGELEILLNEAGRDVLVRELQHLSEASDHFHLGSEDLGGEVPVQTVPYRNGDRIVEWGKVLLRPDAWDKVHFPHVLQGAVGGRKARGQNLVNGLRGAGDFGMTTDEILPLMRGPRADEG